jgi:hypothetical protein
MYKKGLVHHRQWQLFAIKNIFSTAHNPIKFLISLSLLPLMDGHIKMKLKLCTHRASNYLRFKNAKNKIQLKSDH